MNTKTDYGKNLESQIIYLKNLLGSSNAKEELRRFAHHLRNYEYSGDYKNVQSKLLIKAEIIKSIFDLCDNSEEDVSSIKQLLHHTFELNLKIHDKSTQRIDAIKLLAEEISMLDLDNKFSIIIVKAEENYFSIIVEKLFEGVTTENLRFLSNLIIDCCRESLSKQDIFKKLNASLKFVQNCPIKIHCLDKNTQKNKVSGVIDLNKSSNIRIYNFFSGNVAVGYSKLYDTPKQISNFFSLNIVYAISYILAKKNLSVNLEHKRIEVVNTEKTSDKNFQNNVKNIIEYTISRLAEDDKYVIGALDRKFNLNNRVKNFPTDVKQININELDEQGLRNLKKLVSKRINKVSKLHKVTPKLNSEKFDHYVNQHYKLIPQLVMDQAKLIRAKAFFNRGEAADQKGRVEDALQMYSAAIKLDPKFKEAYFSRGMNYFNSENYQQAITDFSKALELDGNYTEAYHYRGLAHAQVKSLSKAITDFNSAIKLDKPHYN